LILANGGTGLFKIGLKKFLKIRIFRHTPFPLHDHCRKNLGWSKAQILVRFVIAQAVLAPLLIILVLKIR
ncbi:MAG: phospho-N-acetylmuramoyl-pentapeptide-transferase, partial [Planctomycetota bacterium]